MNKRLSLFFILIYIFNIEASNAKKNIISNSSYVICDNEIINGSISRPFIGKFYTFDGKLITSMAFKSWLEEEIGATDMLDPKAPKPQPAKFKIIYYTPDKWKVTPKYYVIFFDINDNMINNFPYNGNNPYASKNYLAACRTPGWHGKHRFDEIFDLSIITQEIEKPWYKIW
ncbi:MAG: hypothetical protein P4L22_05525 [Candidatus Babeliales bacterium]|nr:hypothetical protein [Candidatus Babeliales bacterium]